MRLFELIKKNKEMILFGLMERELELGSEEKWFFLLKFINDMMDMIDKINFN